MEERNYAKWSSSLVGYGQPHGMSSLFTYVYGTKNVQSIFWQINVSNLKFSSLND